MTSFSASDVALSGFRFIRSQPRTVAIWAGVNLVFQLVYGLIFVTLAGGKLAEINTFVETNRIDPGAAWAMLPSLSFVFLIALLANLVLLAVMMSAACRARMRPEEVSPGYLRFGADEARMAGLILMWIALVLGYSFLVLFVVTLATAMGGLLPGVLRAIYVLLVAVGGLAAVFYPWVRLSLSLPMTFADRHIHLFDSWKLTKGRFWPLFGTYVLWAILTLVLSLVVFIVVLFVLSAARLSSGGALPPVTDLLTADKSSLASFLRLSTLVADALGAAFSAALLAICVGPFVEAYQVLMAQKAEAEAGSLATAVPATAEPTA